MRCCCCSCRTELHFAGNCGAFIAVFNWCPSCICIITTDISVVVLLKGIVNIRRKGQGGGLFCAVWSCWTDGIKSSQLATSSGPSHRSATFRCVVFLLQLKMWFTSYGAISHLGQQLSTLLQILLK